jgi:hypothetical protein
MLTAGATKEKIIGIIEKKLRMLAKSKIKKVEKKNQPVTTRKMEMTI